LLAIASGAALAAAFHGERSGDPTRRGASGLTYLGTFSTLNRPAAGERATQPQQILTRIIIPCHPYPHHKPSLPSAITPFTQTSTPHILTVYPKVPRHFPHQQLSTKKTSRGTPGLTITILTLEAGQQTTWEYFGVVSKLHAQHRPQARRHTRYTHRPRRVACLPRPHGTHTLFLSRAFTPHFLTYLSSYNSRSSSPPKTRISQITVCLSHASSTSEFFCHDNCASGSHWCWMCEEPTQ
jgi:hypothetical protein